MTLPNGILESHSYDAASELTGIGYQAAGNALGNLAYSYDLAGRRTSVGGSFARTGIPLPVSTTAYNVDNELTQSGTATLTGVYPERSRRDANGNMLSDGTNSFTWDARNHLVSINSGIDTFQYGPLGRRASKTVSGITTNFLYDGANPVQELSGTTVTANMLTGLGVDEYFTRTDSTGASNFLTDRLGSTEALADATGAVQTEYTYEPFGNTTVAGATNASPYQYAGRENDATGLYFYRARYYNPMFGRFISQDPIGFAGSVNVYAYVGNAPTGFVDPLGLDKRDPLKQVVCTALPEGRVVSVGGATGGLGGGTGSVQEVVNYNTGEISAFVTGGLQFGWNGGVSASASIGVVHNLPTNSSYSGPFNNGSVGLPEGPTASGAVSPNRVVIGAVGLNASLVPLPIPTLTYSRTWTSPPLHIGNVGNNLTDPLAPVDLMFYAARQFCR